MSHSPTEPTDLVLTHLNAACSEFSTNVTVMDVNDRLRHDKLISGIVACLKPVGALEIQLAQSIAEDHWRLNRCRALEEGIFSLSHPDPSGDIGPITMQHEIALAQARTFVWKKADFKFLSQYEMRIQRAMDRNKAELKELQTERRKSENGFAFSNHASAAQPLPTEPPAAPAKSSNGFAFSDSPAPDSSASPATANGFAFSTLPTTMTPNPPVVHECP